MRKWLRLGACLIATSLAFMAADRSQAQEPIRIGVLLPLTGPFAKNGIENWEAMQIARDMINERGKIEYVNGDATSPAAQSVKPNDSSPRMASKSLPVHSPPRSRSPLARRPNAKACFIGKRPVLPRSSRAVVSNTRFRSARLRGDTDK